MARANNANSITRTIIIVTGRNANEDATNDECFKPVNNGAFLKKIVSILIRITLQAQQMCIT